MDIGLGKATPADALLPRQLLKEIQQGLASIEDLDQIVLNLLGKVKELLGVSKAGLLLLEEESGRFLWNHALGSPSQPGFFLTRETALIRWLRVNESPLVVEETPGLALSLHPQELSLVEERGFGIFLPITAMNRLIAVLMISEIGAKKRNELLNNLSLLTPHIGIALENAFLLREQRDRFKRMSRADRLATVGELAAGAAHEIRNPLTAIKSTLQYVLSRTEGTAEKRLLMNALEESERIAKLLSDLLAFARPSTPQPETLLLNTLLDSCLDMVRFTAQRQRVEITCRFPSPSPPLWADPSLIKQLFLNLLLNALQAMPTGGKMTLSVEALEGKSVRVTLEDTGEGIPEESLERVFDPFFTLKKGGTGLGLSICYTIARKHEGNIEIRSQQGKGTSVIVTLPLKGTGKE